MLRKFLPIVLAVVVFLFALVFLQPEPNVRVVTARQDLAVGTVLSDNDLLLKDVPKSQVPSDAIRDPAKAIGESLRSDRVAGDVLRTSQLGETIALGPEERALSVKVNDATGLGGLLRPGDNVGMVIVLFDNDGAYAKAAVENLRVLFVSPEFRRGFQETPKTDTNTNAGFSQPAERKTEGTVILAVPAKAVPITYQFKDSAEVREVNALELLSGPNTADNARVMLYALPRGQKASAPASSGLYLPDLKLLTPTPTRQAGAAAVGAAATPTARPTVKP